MGGLSVPKNTKTTVIEGRVNISGSALSVANGNTTTIVSYTVPTGKKFKLDFVEFNGENIANYELLIDNVVDAVKDTYFSGPLFGEFYYGGFEIPQTKVIILRVTHSRPMPGNFNGRINGILQDL